MLTTTDDPRQYAREMALRFRETLIEWRAQPFAEITDKIRKDEIREWVRREMENVQEYDPDWHYFTLGEMTTLTLMMRAEGRAIFNGCTGVWFVEVYGPTVERDDVMTTWRMPHDEWVRHEARRLGFLNEEKA